MGPCLPRSPGQSALFKGHLFYFIIIIFLGVLFCFVLFCFVFCLFGFLGLHPRHMEVPGLGVESEL